MPALTASRPLVWSIGAKVRPMLVKNTAPGVAA
jgi:hypothetical protein